jgi:type IV secretion system protein VirB9
MRPIHFVISICLAALTLVAAAPVMADQPIVTDSRIKTLVYNANEVFTITTHYGYQSNIEFGAKEVIETVSVGDRVAWQIIPSGRRLFIRAQEENAHTNMTVVTNLRAYQFDLRSSTSDAVYGSEELTYVVRFYYPEEHGGIMPASYMPPPAPIASAPVMQAPIMPVSTGAIPTMAAPVAASGYNYRYTFSGPNQVAPVKIYDDGRSTYFKFTSAAAPQFSVITAKGEELAVPAHRVEPNIYAVDVVASRFSLRNNGSQVIVYNESNGA